MIATPFPGNAELARLGDIRARMLRRADRYEATGRADDGRRLRTLAAAARFQSLEAAEDAYRSFAADTATAAQVVSGHYDGLRYVVVDGAVRVDGSRAWRTNNPGGLREGYFTRNHGSVGADKDWAVFPDILTGTAALITYLGTEDVQWLNLETLLTDLMVAEETSLHPMDEIQPVFKSLEIDSDMVISSLAVEQLVALANVLAMWTSAAFGHVYMDAEDAPEWVAHILTDRPDKPRRCTNFARSLRPSLIRPAEEYRPAHDLCVMTCFFNPSGSASRLTNLKRFLATMARSGITCYCIECAFGATPFALPETATTFRVRSESVMWQKERLLNILIRRLPTRFRKVTWVDADVLFSNPDWMPETSAALNEYPVIQPFIEVVRLPQETDRYVGRGDRFASFAHLFQINPESASGASWFDHGHTGLAWAARRDWVEENGLYDACLAGNGDHAMAHALVGTWETGCIGITSPSFKEHFVSWAQQVYPSTMSRLACIDGHALTLWHGDHAARNYHGALVDLNDLAFDPAQDLRMNPYGAWEWASDNHRLHRWSLAYLLGRQEDGRETFRDDRRQVGHH